MPQNPQEEGVSDLFHIGSTLVESESIKRNEAIRIALKTIVIRISLSIVHFITFWFTKALFGRYHTLLRFTECEMLLETFLI